MPLFEIGADTVQGDQSTELINPAQIVSIGKVEAIVAVGVTGEELEDLTEVRYEDYRVSVTLVNGHGWTAIFDSDEKAEKYRQLWLKRI